MIDQFRRSPTLKTFTITRDTPRGSILSIAYPIRVNDKSCLDCHSTPQAAPASMVDLYGSANGFGWKLGEVVGAQDRLGANAARVARARMQPLSNTSAAWR